MNALLKFSEGLRRMLEAVALTSGWLLERPVERAQRGRWGYPFTEPVSPVT
jgi:hypothetical protein